MGTDYSYDRDTYKNRDVDIMCNNIELADVDRDCEHRSCFMQLGPYYNPLSPHAVETYGGADKLPGVVHVFPGYCNHCFHEKDIRCKYKNEKSHFMENLDAEQRAKSICAGFSRLCSNDLYVVPNALLTLMRSYLGDHPLKSLAELDAEESGQKHMIYLDCIKCGCTYYSIDMSYDKGGYLGDTKYEYRPQHWAGYCPGCYELKRKNHVCKQSWCSQVDKRIGHRRLWNYVDRL